MVRGLVAILLTVVCAGTQAREVVWTGSVSDDFAVGGNWSGGVPVPGDVAKFLSSAAVGGTFDFGAKGLTLDVAANATVTCRVDFAGAGRLVKLGGGTLLFDQAQTGSFTGGLRVEDGVLTCLRPQSATWWSTYVGDKSSVVELVLKGDVATDPKIAFKGWGGHLTNPVRVTGTGAADHLTFTASDKAALGGDLSAETCVRFVGYSGDRDYRLGGNVSMLGQTLFCDTRSASAVMCVGAGDYWIHKTFVGNLTTVGKGTTQIWAKGTDPANELFVGCRTELARAWQGTNIVVSGASAVLSVGVQNDKTGEPYNYGSLSSNACVRLLDGAKLELVVARDNRIRALTVGNESLPEGRYTSADRPDIIQGAGALCIGACKEWIGGSEGLLSDGANWSDGQPARGGESLIFKKRVILQDETVDFGAGGLAFVCGKGCEVTNRASYAGSGRIVKRGPGTLVVRKADTGTFTGGVRVEDGVLLLAASASEAGWNGTALGDAKSQVEVVVEGACRPQIVSQLYGVRLQNPVHVTGSACSTNYYVLSSANRGGFNRITADGDFAYSSGYHSSNVLDDLFAPGRTVLVNAGSNEMGTEGSTTFCTTAVFRDPVEASIVKVSPANLQLDIGTTNAANGLVVAGGRVTFDYLCRWAGTNVVVRGASSRLVAMAAQNLSDAAIVRLEGGGKIEVTADVEVAVGELLVDGAPVRRGTYDATTLPQAVIGGGRLRVGARGLVVMLGESERVAPPDDPRYPMHEGRRLVWHDEFNGPSLDTAKWRIRHISDRTDVTYVVDARTLRMEDGCLRLMVRASGNAKYPWLMPENVVTHDTMGYRYGYLEMRANIPFRHGAWPAFWLQSTPKLQTASWMSEVDIFEVFSSPHTLNSTLHKWGPTGHVSCSVNQEGSKETYRFADYANLNSEFHIYALEWTPERMRFFVDGVCYDDFAITPDKDFGTDVVPGVEGFHDFHSIILSDGIFTPGSGWQVPSWYLNENDELPVDFRVDWIRLWQKPEGEELRMVE